MGHQGLTDVFTIKASHYIIAGMSLATALSWNTVIKDSINKTFPMANDALRANVLYSLIMTLILAIIIWFLPDTKSELPAEVRHKLNLTELAHYKKTLRQDLLDAQRQIKTLSNRIRELEKY